MSPPVAGDGILAHLDRLIAALETRTSEQISDLMALVKADAVSREAEAVLWRDVDNLLALRRQQMLATAMLIENATGCR